MSYFEWHQEPGYWRDITRHFAPDVSLLDIGCGTAWLSRHFQHYTGIDGSSDAVRQAVAAGLNVQQGDVSRALPFPDASFDGAVLKDLLEHVPDPVFTVTEALRVLRAGGRLFASSPDAQRWVWDDYTHRRPFTLRAFRRLFSDQGFEVDAAGHESVMPGSSILSARTRDNRRPAALRAYARLPVCRRNVWVVVRRP